MSSHPKNSDQLLLRGTYLNIGTYFDYKHLDFILLSTLQTKILGVNLKEKPFFLHISHLKILFLLLFLICLKCFLFIFVGQGFEIDFVLENFVLSKIFILPYNSFPKF